MAVIATAGHIDHGKSALVRAMTGIEPDRLEEERRRGLTLDLGFGHVTARDGTVLDIVDVPGHADYLKTMIAGMSHASIALLVIDAVEGCRAQTIEHLAVIDSIRPLTGVVALTRVDLVSADRRVEVEREVDELLAVSPISWSQPLCTSAVTGEGIDSLVDTLAEKVREVEASEQALSELPARLFVDRVFSVSGAGTVVTGTLSSGSICAGDEFLIAGTDQRVNVRSVQRHGTNCDQIAAVRRTAVNLSGVSTTDLGRGDVIIAAARWAHTDVVDVQVELLEGVTIRNGKGFSAHIGSARRDVTLRPVGGTEGAERGWFRMRFPDTLPLAPRDRLLLRDQGSGTVVGVATIGDVSPVVAPSRATPDGSIDQQLVHHGWVTIEEAQRLTGRVVEPYVGRWIAAKSVIDESIAALRERLSQSTIETAECTEIERALLQMMDGVVIEHGAARIGESDPALESPLVDRLLAEGVSTGPVEANDRKVAARLVRLGVLVSHDDVYFHVDVIRSLEPILELLWSADPDGFTVAELRNALGVTRKHALPLANCLDQVKITRRVGDRRVRGRGQQR
ncbi:MAG TPA: selenocysteine-specific translation elongation factor [Acidimicrobiaceae bacterium]|nr:selenocysteine-specific translation elongation factor [Acidimicrobiaceae bacterium]